ncbi:MAG: transposase [Cyclobacteriaceae bacterium]
MQIEKHPVQFFTAVCYDWLKLLDTSKAKEIIIEALRYRVSEGHIRVAAFVIMPNHIHLIWRVQNGYELEDVQRDFLKYTAKGLLTLVKNSKGERGLEELFPDLSLLVRREYAIGHFDHFRTWFGLNGDDFLSCVV